MHRLLLLSLLWIASPPAHAGDATPLRIESPNGNASVETSLDAQGQPHFAVAWQGRPCCCPRRLACNWAMTTASSRGLRLIGEQRSAADTQYDLVAGKAKRVRDHYRHWM